MQRRQFFYRMAIFLPAIFLSFFLKNKLFAFFSKKINFRYVRPPGTTDEEDFLSKCIRCRECANVCDAGCIRFFAADESLYLAGTPYLNTRLKSCNLCMNCTQVCPTGALLPIEREINEIKEKVN